MFLIYERNPEQYTGLKRMVKLNVIEPSISPWSSLDVSFREPNGKPRICLDSKYIVFYNKNPVTII